MKKIGSKFNIEKTDHGIRSHHFMGNRWGNSGNSVRLYFGGSKITVDGDCSHETKRRLLLGRKVMTFSLSSFTFIKRLFSFLHFLPLGWCHLCICKSPQTMYDFAQVKLQNRFLEFYLGRNNLKDLRSYATKYSIIS